MFIGLAFFGLIYVYIYIISEEEEEKDRYGKFSHYVGDFLLVCNFSYFTG